MIERLKSLFGSPEDEPTQPDSHQLAVAATALMVQLSRVDNDQDDEELKTIVNFAVEAHQVTRDEAEEILQDALNQADDATSLYEFTGLINEQLSQEEKQALLESIWRVAFADGRIDKYEDYTIRKIADLIYVKHEDFMKAKHR